MNFLRTYSLIFIAALLFFVVAPQTTMAAAVVGTADFVWFSKEPMFAGDQVDIFVLLYNSSAYHYRGTIELLDGTTSMAQKEFGVSPSGAASIITFPWRATPGSHVFHAVVKNAELLKEGRTVFMGGLGNVEIVQTGLTERMVSEDVDFDQDGVGNLSDSDDDDDELFDEKEGELKTDPLNKDTDADGIIDGKDANPTVFDAPPPPPPIPQKSAFAGMEEGINKALPAPVAGMIIPILGGAENFRLGLALHASEKLYNVAQELLSEAAEESAAIAPEVPAGTSTPEMDATTTSDVATTTSAQFPETPLGTSSATTTGTTSEAVVESSPTPPSPPAFDPQMAIGMTEGFEIFGSGMMGGRVFTSPIGYTKLFLLLFYQFFTTNVYAFYILVAFIAFKVLDTVVSLFSSKRE